METIQLKIEFENALRRASVSRNETLAKLKATIASLVGITDCDIKYRDEENDLITIGSDEELQEVLATNSKSGKVLRLIVSQRNPAATSKADEQDEKPQAAAESSQTAPPPPPPQPEIPWVNLARALSDPEVVTRVQTVLQSPIITETITRASKAYVDSKGDYLVAGLVASQQIPMLLGLVGELLEELPVLKDLQTLVMTWFANGGGCRMPPPPPHAAGPHPPPPFAFPFVGGHPFFGGGHHGAPHHGGPHHGGPHHCGPHGGPHHGGHHGGWGGHHEGPHFKHKHFNVYCDGCSSDEALKQQSIAAGHHTRRGFINGLRFKSQTIQDFDLCETCKANAERFPERAYGPFTTIEPPQQFPGAGGPRGGRGGGCWWRPAAAPTGQQQRNWRAGGQEAEKEAEPVQQQQQPQQQQGPSPPFDFMEAIRAALSKGTEAFAEAAKNDTSDFGEIARALAESLKTDAEDKQATPTATPAPSSPNKDSEWVPVATPVQQQQQAEEEDPFVKWASQLAQLQTLGFDNLETYIEFLEEEKGDLDRVVNRIVRRDA